MKNFTLKFLFAILLFSSLLTVPLSAGAQTSSQSAECERLRTLINSNGGGSAAALPAYCDVGTIYSKLTYWMYYIIGIVAVISLIYAGYLYMTARDNEAQLKKAKSTMIWTIAGVVLAVLATIIVGAVINLIVDNKIF